MLVDSWIEATTLVAELCLAHAAYDVVASIHFLHYVAAVAIGTPLHNLLSDQDCEFSLYLIQFYFITFVSRFLQFFATSKAACLLAYLASKLSFLDRTFSFTVWLRTLSNRVSSKLNLNARRHRVRCYLSNFLFFKETRFVRLASDALMLSAFLRYVLLNFFSLAFNVHQVTTRLNCYKLERW